MQSQHEYLRELAVSLRDSVGFECALDYARQNQWEGVTEELLNLPGQGSSGSPETDNTEN